MSRHVEDIGALNASQDPTELIEGSIWWPPYCPFCDVSSDSVIAESRHALAIPDQYPVNPGHTLVIPRAHSRSLFTHSSEAQADIWHLVAKVRDHLQTSCNPDGFNIGINDGSAGGQTVNHAHIHVIPRFDGDVADPRGGIRWILPDRAAYWDQ
ncbi:MAG: HIT family protein [Gemmatimonadetes bacterium]|nr:HIT family protein [Gemmatimonadota bacterium]